MINKTTSNGVTRNLKFFFIAFLASLPFWWGINVLGENLEDFLFWQELNKNPQILAAQAKIQVLEEELQNRKPIRNGRIEDLKLETKSAISFLINPDGKKKILFEKESTALLPIASLTKLMSAYIILEYYDLEESLQINKEAAEQPGIGAGKLKIGERFRIKDLLYPMLMESNNGAAYALAEVVGQAGFVELMNLEAENLGLKNSYFADPTGLAINYSTTQDLVKLTEYLLQKPLIWEILSRHGFKLYSSDGVFHHKVVNTNELLGEIPSIIGGKTGFTYEAGECFLLVLEAPNNNGYLINVILGSQNRFEEMKKLINWLKEAYLW